MATFGIAVIVALVLSLLNFLVKPLLVILTLPVTIITFGLFLLVINALIILMAGGLVSGFAVDGFWWALLFSLLHPPPSPHTLSLFTPPPQQRKWGAAFLLKSWNSVAPF